MNNGSIQMQRMRKSFFKRLIKFTDREPTKEFDWQIIRKDGTKRYIEASVSLQKDSSGKPKGLKGYTDITSASG